MRTRLTLGIRLLLWVLLLPLGVLGCRTSGSGPRPLGTVPAQEIRPTPTVSVVPSATSTLTPTATATPVLQSETPDWFRNALLYEIYVRSFADSNGDGIGDLNGITQRLDYLQRLGVQVIWLMPIYPSPSVHGYDVTDFRAVNPDYGTLDDLHHLVQAAHQHGIRVILDFVPSHLSREHPFFKDAYGNPQSPYSDWFVWTNEAHTTYATFGGSAAMPRFNHYNPAVVQYLIQSALFWIDPNGDGDPNDGVDGFRVDNVTFPPPAFLRAFYRAIKQVNPNALLLGEAWVHRPYDLRGFFPAFDALFDFPFYELLMRDPTAPEDGLLAGNTPPVLLKMLLQDEAKAYPPDKLAVRFFSNHDTDRLATELAGDPARERLAMALLAAWPGPVMLYYGEEIGMPGHKGGPPYWDAYRRAPMDWYAAEVGPGQTTWFRPPDRGNRPHDRISVEEEETDPASLLNFTRRVFRLREATPALAHGDFAMLPFTADHEGPFVFRRAAPGEPPVVVALNFGRQAAQVTFTPATAAPRWHDLLSEATFTPAADGTLTLTLPPAGILWLTPEE